jgi:rhodanese-related sulfurtransferase
VPPRTRMSRSLMIALDLCLVIGVMATCWHLAPGVSPFFAFGKKPPELPPIANVGTRLRLQALWPSTQYERTAVLMVDTNCQACALSRPFYKRLADEARAGRNTRFVVLTEEPVEVARPWLLAEGVEVQVVHIGDRRSFGFLGTPSLVITDSKGEVTDIVLGVLGESHADRFIARLKGHVEAAPLVLPYSISEVRRGKAANQSTSAQSQVIDTREPAVFAKSHSSGAMNIPLNELVRRAPVELRRDDPVTVDCLVGDQSQCRVVAAALGDLGFKTVFVLLP